MRAKRAAARTVALVLLVGGCSQREQPAGTSSVAAPFSGPSLVAPKIDGSSVKLDGVLDEAAWASAAKTEAFVMPRSGQRAAGALQGHARIFWDEAFLYVAFEANDDEIRGGFPTNSVDPHLWERDTVEMIIDPDGADNRDYYEIQINPQGLVFDSQFDDYNLPHGGPAGPFGHQEWSSQVERAVKIDGTLDDASDRDRGYVVESKIPWAAFQKAKRAPPAPGDTWKMNFYVMKDNGGVAWSPILGEGNFHKVAFFGDVKFGP